MGRGVGTSPLSCRSLVLVVAGAAVALRVGADDRRAASSEPWDPSDIRFVVEGDYAGHPPNRTLLLLRR